MDYVLIIVMGRSNKGFNMKSNMGNLDRGIRISIALLIAVLYFAGMLSGVGAVVLGVVAVVLLLTSAIGFCPAYLPLGLSTKEKKG